MTEHAETERSERERPRRRMAWVRSPFLWGILVVVALVVLASRLHSTEHDVATAYRHFSWTRFPWLVLALGSEAISFLCYAQVQRLLLRAGGAHLTRRTMVALAVAATGLTNLVPGGTAPASGWLVGQYRRRAVPMPLALWSVLAGGFAATVSILLLLLVGAAVAGFLAVWEMSPVRWSCWPGWWGWWRRCTICRRSPGGWRRCALDGGCASCAVWPTRHRGDAFPDHGARRSFVLGFSVANWTMDVFVLIGAFGLLGLPIPLAGRPVRLRRRSGGRQSGSGTGGSGLRGGGNDRRLRSGRRRVG